MTQKSLGAALRLVREEKFPVAKDFVEASGVAASQLSEMEKGHRTLTYGFLNRVAPHLGMTPEQLRARIDELAASIEGADMIVESRTTPYLVTAKGPLTKTSNHTGDPFEELARYFAAKLTSSEILELIHEFTTEAANGNRAAGLRAKALIDILDR